MSKFGGGLANGLLESVEARPEKADDDTTEPSLERIRSRRVPSEMCSPPRVRSKGDAAGEANGIGGGDGAGEAYGLCVPTRYDATASPALPLPLALSGKTSSHAASALRSNIDALNFLRAVGARIPSRPKPSSAPAAGVVPAGVGDSKSRAGVWGAVRDEVEAAGVSFSQRTRPPSASRAMPPMAEEEGRWHWSRGMLSDLRRWIESDGHSRFERRRAWGCSQNKSASQFRRFSRAEQGIQHLP